ncbi:ACT domain-containing protein [Sphingomonas psychrotolerans]|uniref:ACT domain-containing protein n=1 Tax=Sphingomonas psychrotolerans TaxID=1327635 RepID=UPI00268E6F22
MTSSWLPTLDCEDRPGIAAAVSGFLAECGGFILDSQQYAHLDAGRFFMRVEFKAAGYRRVARGVCTGCRAAGAQLDTFIRTIVSR